MTPDYPNDADGDALRGVAADNDMSRSMLIDFFVAVPDRESGFRIAGAAEAAGYRPSVEMDDESQKWTCYCSKEMLATYAGVISAQEELAAIAASVEGCMIDGWGTLGNVTNG